MSLEKRSMGLDVGDKRIGIALSDPLGMFALPHSTIDHEGSRALEEIITVMLANSVNTVVIGLPKELNGNIGPQAEKVKTFLESLTKRLEQHPELSTTKTVLWDERLTSVQAERMIAGSGLKNRKRREALDRVSAAIILEGYLASGGVQLPTITY